LPLSARGLPASCAGELARKGHDVTLFEKRDLPAGFPVLEYWFARARGISLAEVEMIQRLESASKLAGDRQGLGAG